MDDGVLEVVYDAEPVDAANTQPAREGRRREEGGGGRGR